MPTTELAAEVCRGLYLVLCILQLWLPGLVSDGVYSCQDSLCQHPPPIPEWLSTHSNKLQKREVVF